MHSNASVRWRARSCSTLYLTLVVVGGFLKSYIEGLLAAAVAFLFVLPGIGAWGTSLFLCVGSIAHIAFTLASGFLVRRIGVRRLIVVAAALPIVAVCFYVLPSCGIVPLAIGNAIKGSSFGILTAVSPLLIVEKTEEERRGRGSAFFQLSMQIGSVVGALLGAGVSALFRQRLQLAIDIDFMLMLLPVALFLPLGQIKKNVILSSSRRIACGWLYDAHVGNGGWNGCELCCRRVERCRVRGCDGQSG